jgi:hypothetical protein
MNKWTCRCGYRWEQCETCPKCGDTQLRQQLDDDDLLDATNSSDLRYRMAMVNRRNEQ